MRRAALLTSLALALPSVALASPTTPGAVTFPHPTLENVSIEWAVAGDDDADGVVTVRFREQGAAAWRDGLPLRRLPAGQTDEGFAWTNKHAGSLFGLSPDTTYEVELTLTDPDGGGAVVTQTVKTRPVPAPMPGAPEIAVDPSSIGAALAAAQPGDVLVLADGTYAEIDLLAGGAPGMPVVLRAANPGYAIVQGDVRFDYLSHVIVDGLVVNGKIKFNGAADVAVVNNVVITAADGIQALAEGATDAYVCDNDVTGPSGWADDTVGADGNNLGEGIELTGSGNVICRNHVRGFRDCVSLVEDTGNVQTSIDIFGNDLELCADDAVEADFSNGNVRVYRNRIRNSFVGLSSQPSIGGPTYFIRNVMYNVIYSPFKLHRGSIGDVAFHNTAVKTGDAFAVYAAVTWDRAWFRNNLFLGGTGGGVYGGYGNGSGLATDLSAAGPLCDFDYDGLGSIGTGTFQGDIGGVSWDGLAELHTLTTEAHAVQVDLSVFDAAVAFPASPFPELPAPVLTLAPGGAAVDKGEVLPNVDDDFEGAAPDLGAYEVGQPVPGYGPGSSASGGGGGFGGGGGNGTGGNGTGGAGPGGGGGAGGGGGSGGGTPGQSGGCGCAVPPGGPSPAGALALLAFGAAFARRRRR